jgi:hypothetical protein
LKKGTKLESGLLIIFPLFFEGQISGSKSLQFAMKGRASFLDLLSLAGFYFTKVEQGSLFPLSMSLFNHNLLILTLQH